MDNFDKFKQKEKFVEDQQLFYPGLANPELRTILTEKINQTADDFKQASLRSDTSSDDYREIIKKSLDGFRELYLDTEDRERVCHYFEELMDLVNLDSSGGLLNIYMYGFNPDNFAR